MRKQKNNIFLFFILLFISIVLASSLVIQYILGHQPCNLCVYQRVPYIFSIILIAQLLLFNKYEKISLLIISLLFIGNFFLSIYHVGIEQGIFSESLFCETKNVGENLSKEQLLKQLEQNLISCKDVSIRVFGLSLAAINIIFSIILSIMFVKFFMNSKINK